MEDSKEIHEEILLWVSKEFKEILDNSEQAIYVYVCDRHKLCNKKFYSMLGYNSSKEWAMKDEMLSDVRDKDQEILVSAYRNAMKNKVGSSINISWKNKKNGNFVKTNVIIVPLSYKGQLFAIHFIKTI